MTLCFIIPTIYVAGFILGVASGVFFNDSGLHLIGLIGQGIDLGMSLYGARSLFQSDQSSEDRLQPELPIQPTTPEQPKAHQLKPDPTPNPASTSSGVECEPVLISSSKSDNEPTLKMWADD